MKISAIIPLSNSSGFIVESVESILKQTYRDFELILVDDFSTDNTLAIAQEYHREHPNIVVITNIYKKGISGAMNTGLDLAQGELIAYLDHDDVSLPERFETQVSFLEANPTVGVCGTWMQEFEGGNSVWRFPTENDDLKAIALLHSPIANPTAMLRKDILNKNRVRYKSEYDPAQDYEFWLQLMPFINFANIPEVLVKYRIHSTNASRVLSDKQYESWKRAIKPYMEKLEIEQTDLLFESLYNMKYPDFFKRYNEHKGEVDELINKILLANDIKGIFPADALRRLFYNKIKTWEDKFIE